jgi:predicted aspartyl protease
VAFAQVYRWVDEKGTVHYATGLERVPERYRRDAQRLPEPSPAPAVPETSAAPPGGTRIAFTLGSPILVSARINGAGPLILVLDTGADRTLVAPSALWALGISTEGAMRAEVRGVTGTSQAALVWVNSVEVGEARVGPLPIIAHDAGLKDGHGLLGRDFLDRFKVTIDSEAGLVTLAPR